MRSISGLQLLHKIDRVPIFIFTLLAILLWPGINTAQQANYKDSTKSVDERVADLLSRMTVQEKIFQLRGSGSNELIPQMALDNLNEMSPIYQDFVKSGIGWIHTNNMELNTYVNWVNATQKNLMEKSRLGIPALVIAEGLHGLMSYEGTVFPSCIALAGTFDTTLVQKIYARISKEGRSRGTNLFLSPVLDVGREPRWGRQEETFGEDPYLVSKMGIAATLGFQGENFKIPNDKSAVCLKHFVGHGAPESGSYAGPLQSDDRTLHEVHLAPFKTVIDRLEPGSIMATYHPVNGVPMCINKTLLTDLLKENWGFKGPVFSDGHAIPQLIAIHHVAEDSLQAGLRAFKAGVDCELADGDKVCFNFIQEAYEKGLVTKSELDNGVGRILRLKFRLGLFENPYVQSGDALRYSHSNEAIQLSLEAAEKSIVLLKNDNDILPIDKYKVKSIAIIGPMSDRADFGAYIIAKHEGVSPLAAIRDMAGKKITVNYAKGCKITTKENLDWFGRTSSDTQLEIPDNNQPLIDEAVSAAQKSDLVLLFLGEYDFMGGETWTDHLGDKANLDLLGSQNELLRAISETGKQIVAVQFNSGARSYTSIAEKANAILECWYLGEQNGKAVANIIFGDVNPSAKLPVSIPRSAGHLPVYYSKLPIARPGYIFEDISPLFPFGFGLSYTTFEYSNMQLDSNSIKNGKNATLTVDITNTGDRVGTEVVQLYIRDTYASITRPIKELKGFSRITLQPGEKGTIKFIISPDKLSYYNINNEFAVESGEFELMVGTSSIDTESINLIVTDY